MRKLFFKTAFTIVFQFIFISIVSAQLSGTYTVGKGSGYDYSSPQAAAADLSLKGINAAVIIKIDAGTYTGKISLNKITGLSAKNTLTFSGLVADSSQVTIMDSGKYVFQLSSMKYVVLEFLTLKATATNTKTLDIEQCEDLIIRNCQITSGEYGAYGADCKNIKFDKVAIINANNGLYLSNSSGFGENHQITHCYLNKNKSNGIYLNYQRDVTIDGTRSDSSNYAINVNSCNNVIINQSYFRSTYASYFSYVNYSNIKAGDSILITNNQFISKGNTTYGLYANNCNYAKWYHNSCDLSGSDYGAYWYNSNYCEYINNNILVKGGLAGFYVNKAPVKMSNNNFHNWSGTFCFFGAKSYSNFSDFLKGTSPLNANTYNIANTFSANGEDLRTQSSNLNNKGLFLNHPLTRRDYDRNRRPAKGDTLVDIGCNDYYLNQIDLSIDSILSPKSIALGKNQVSVLIHNEGAFPISSSNFDIAYSIDNGATWVYDTLKISYLNTGTRMNFDFTQKLNITSKGNYFLVVKLFMGPSRYDSLFVGLCTGVSGKFIIGNSIKADFYSFKDAIDILKCGITGPVLFEIEKGVYNENVKLPAILGTDKTNTITFRSKHIDSVTIKASSENTIQFEGADFVRFENMRIEATGSSGFAVHMYKQSNHNKFSGCVIQSNPKIASAYSHPLVISGSTTGYVTLGDNGHYNIFENNQFIGGYAGVCVHGENSSNMAMGNQFLNNEFVQSYYYGALFYYNDGLVFKDNYIHGLRNTTNSYGHLVNYISNFEWERNTIEGSVTGNYFYYANFYNYNGAVPSRFVNNSYTGNNSGYALYLYQASNVDFWHNSLYGKGSYLLYANNMSNGDLRNNIFYYDGNGHLLYAPNSSFREFDYNDYFSTNGVLAYLDNSYLNIQDLKKYDKKFNQNNWSIDPEWVDPEKDLHVTSSFPNMWGARINEKLDIDGDIRCQFYAAIGADDFQKYSTLPTANFSIPDTAWLGSTFILYNSAKNTDNQSFKWYINGVYVDDSIHLEYTPTKIGYDTVSLVMTNCTGSDSIAKRIFVYPVQRKPKADFWASFTKIYTGETIALLDLSKNGPTSWYWKITPQSFAWGHPINYRYVDSTNERSPYPKVEFFVPGLYTVSLIAANKYGVDSIIKKHYIKVIPKVKMCDTPSQIDFDEGKLFDDGGENDDYYFGVNCNYLISACRGELELDIKEFELAKNDYLRIYDGRDKRGRPLWDTLNFPKGFNGNISDLGNYDHLVALSGSAFIEFESDNDAHSVAKGFAIEWKYNKSSTWPNSPDAKITGPDSTCLGFPTVFSNASTGVYNHVTWDLDLDDKIDGISQNFSTAFTTAGTYLLKIKVYSLCAPMDSFIKKIVAQKAIRAPKPDFSASQTIAAVGDTIWLSSSSDYCTENTLWHITPTSYSIVNQGKLTDNDIGVVFYNKGFYNIEVEKSNPFGKDSLYRPNYIEIIKYCEPSVITNQTDLGISRMVFGSIDKKSTCGKSSYQNFTYLTTEVERGRSYPIQIERTTNTQNISRAVWIDWNQDGEFDETTELVAYQASSTDMAFKDTIKIDPKAKPGKTRMRVGVNLAGKKNTPCGPNNYGEYEDYSIWVSPYDKTAPRLNLKGGQFDTIEVYSTWKDPGFTVLI